MCTRQISPAPCTLLVRNRSLPRTLSSQCPPPCTLSGTQRSLPRAHFSLNGRDGAHRARFPSRTSAYRVHKGAGIVHGRGSPVPGSARGGGAFCRVHFPSGSPPHRVHSGRGARAPCALSVRNGSLPCTFCAWRSPPCTLSVPNGSPPCTHWAPDCPRAHFFGTPLKEIAQTPIDRAMRHTAHGQSRARALPFPA